jgi:hypothetical protein
MQIKFFKRIFAVLFKHVRERVFRLNFYFKGKEESDIKRAFGVDLKFDEFSYFQFFKKINIDEFLERHLQFDREQFLVSHHLVHGEQLVQKLRESIVLA